MSASADHAAHVQAIEAGFESLPGRYLGTERGFDATFRVVLDDLGQTWEVRCSERRAQVRLGAAKRPADVTFTTDAATWSAIRRGELAGSEAFRRRRLGVRGKLELAIAFEGLFRLENGGAPLLRVHGVRLGLGRRMSTLSTGEGPDLLMIHGLGSTKSSFVDAAAILGRHYRVHAIDLLGFGMSSKPASAPYTARWFADTVLEAMDELDIARAHIAGNSLGGRVAIELALRHPERVRALALLSPAVAFVKRDLHHVVRLLRPEVGLLPHQFTRGMIEQRFWALFADPDCVDPSLADTVVDEFRRTYASPGGRVAFLAAARNIYLDEPFGPRGFYPRLAELSVPALWLWGAHDVVIRATFRHHVAQWLPDAEQVVLDDCGHVPQVERPERTSELLHAFFERSDRRRRPRRRAHTAA